MQQSFPEVFFSLRNKTHLRKKLTMKLRFLFGVVRNFNITEITQA